MNRFIHLLILALIIPWAANVSYTQKSFYIEDSDVQMISPDQSIPTDSSILSVLDSQQTNEISLPEANAGTFFDDAIRISMSKQGQKRVGSTVQEFNSSQTTIFMKYNINDTAPVKVTFQSASGSTIDTLQYGIYMEVFEGPGFEFSRDFRNSFDIGGLPLIIDYVAQDISNDHFMLVDIFDNLDFEISAGETIAFNVTIEQLAEGTTLIGGAALTTQSSAFEQMLSSRAFFNQQGYLNQALNVDLGDFNGSDASFAKGIGMSVFGLLKGAEIIARSGKADLATQDLTMAEYMQIAINLFNLANDTMLEAGGFFYYRPSESAPQDTVPDYTVYLEDNVWMLVALGEIQNYQNVFGPATNAVIDQLAVQNRMGLIGDWIVTLFESGVAGDYRYRVSITDFLEDGNGVFAAGSDTGAFTRDDLVYLEPAAVLMDVLRWNFFMTFAAGATEMDEILNFINTNLKVTQVDGVPISAQGIFAEYYNTSNSAVSPTATLAGNAAYILHLNTRVKEGFDADRRQSLDVAGEIAQNILRSFESSNDKTAGLLYSSIDLQNRNNSKQLITTLDNAQMIAAINRIGVNWEELDPIFDNVDDTSKETNARAWKRKSLDQQNILKQIMYDEIEEVYFAKFDDQAKILVADDNFVTSNSFVSNAYLYTIFSDVFPIQMKAIFQNKAIVDKVAQITLSLSQIISVGSWIYWDPFNPFTVDVKVEIPEFGYLEELTVDLLSSFLLEGPSGDVLLSFFYDVALRGEYTVNIELSREGSVLLAESLELIALGLLSAEFLESQLTFSTSDSSFTASFSLFDERGLTIPSLSVEAALGTNLDLSQQQFGNKYIENARTDSSGKISFTFDISEIEEDGILSRDQILLLPEIPDFIELEIFANVTNVDTFNLDLTFLRVPVKVELAKFYGDFDESSLQFGTNDDEFKATITILDVDGIAVPNLAVEASLGSPLVQSRIDFGDTYIETATTDSSGKATFTFDVSDFEDDFVNRDFLETLPFFPEFIFSIIQMNITSDNSFNYAGFILAEARVTLGQVNLRVSPTNLEITQGTTEAFSFTVLAVDQDQSPISNAQVTYTLDTGLYQNSNTVITDADGEATITLRDNDLFALSNLAILENIQRDPTTQPDPVSANATITMDLVHTDFPLKSISKQITVLPNSIRIIANPVQSTSTEQTVFEDLNNVDKSRIDVEVATEDLFSRVISAFVSLAWVDDSNNQYFDLSADKFKRNIAPATFQIDPTNLPAGEYPFRIIATKDGITETVIVGNQLTLAQIERVSIPVEAIRNVIIEENTIEDVLLSGIALFGVFILLRAVNFVWGKLSNVLRITQNCPHCYSIIGRNQKVCNYCGRDAASTTPSDETKPSIEPSNQKALDNQSNDFNDSQKDFKSNDF